MSIGNFTTPMVNSGRLGSLWRGAIFPGKEDLLNPKSRRIFRPRSEGRKDASTSGENGLEAAAILA
jgi:hypothetical protein